MRPELAVLQELVDVVPGAPLRRSDRARFLRAVGVGGQTPVPAGVPSRPSSAASGIAASRSALSGGVGEFSKAHILRSIGDAAYEMPLPPRWTEQVDVRGYVYFAHALRSEATWEHPLLHAFRETVEFSSDLMDSPLTLQETAAAVESHLQGVQHRAAEQLQEWSGPHRAAGGADEFFHNEVTGESSWVSPLEVWQYELHARYWLLVQLLQRLHGDREAEECRRERSHSKRMDSGAPAACGIVAETPRFAGETGSTVGSKELPPILRKISESSVSCGVSIGESGLSLGGISAAVRSCANEIASSLASSAPSFGVATRFPVGIAPWSTGGPAPPAPPPRPPPKPPPPMRHLAAPPRVSDMPPEMVLRAQSPPLTGPSLAVQAGPGSGMRVGLAAGKKAPPPPPPKAGRGAGELGRRVPPKPPQPVSPGGVGLGSPSGSPPSRRRLDELSPPQEVDDDSEISAPGGQEAALEPTRAPEPEEPAQGREPSGLSLHAQNSGWTGEAKPMRRDDGPSMVCAIA